MKLEKIEPILSLPEFEEDSKKCREEFKEWFREDVMNELYFVKNN